MLNNVIFCFWLPANFDENANKNANTGHASAKVYFIGPQYDTEIPVKHKNNTSTILSTHIYTEINVNIYERNVFLSVFSTFKNLSKYFKLIHHFQNNHTYILSYKMAKKTIDFKKIILFFLKFHTYINR